MSGRYANEKNIGKRCILTTMQLQTCPYFPAEFPFRIIGAAEDRYLVEGPWTEEITWIVKANTVRISPKELSTVYVDKPVERDTL